MPGGLSVIDQYVAPPARAAIADAIADAGGNEVFFVGTRGEDGLVQDVEVHCRGNKGAVPALRQVGRHGEVVIHNHPSGALFPSEPDLALASHYGQEGVGFFIVDNDATAVYVVVEPPKERRTVVDPAAVEAALTGRGGLPDLLPGYEPRDAQLQMATAVASAQNDGRVLVVEAGTGTGKSLAYLLPSAMRALAGGERVAIATRTRHLQRQLETKDVALLRKMWPELRVALLKGRRNYLCRRKLQDRLAEADSHSDSAEREFLNEVKAWSEVTSQGDRDDLPFMPERDLWELVESSSEHTLRVRCPHYDQCFYYNSRRKAAQAHLLLANHHLLLADLALRADGASGGLLPRYEHIVLDEAHHLEDAATDFAGLDVSGRGLLQRLGRIRPRRQGRKGLATRLLSAVTEEDSNDESLNLADGLAKLLDSTESCRTNIELHLEDVGEAVLDALSTHDAHPGQRSSSDGRGRPRGPARATFRVQDDLAEVLPALSALLDTKLGDIARALGRVASAVELVRDRLKDMPERFARRHLQISMDLGSVRNRLIDSASALTRMLVPDAETVRWIEVNRGRDNRAEPRFLLRPIDAGGVVRELLLPGARSHVWTSATLSVAGSFHHFLDRAGVNEDPEAVARTETKTIPSPFNYARQVVLGIPSDLPEPGKPGYDRAVIDLVAQAIRITEGRTFVLFTSYRMLRDVAGAVQGRLGREHRILRQGELPRDRLLQLFRSGSRHSLFGTDSFWEGVDVRGEALSSVILPRLPFRVPTEPVQVARAERIESRGGDAFSDLSVPQAVLKFRQGFGRLIRHRLDSGVVLVLDTRILRRRYGKEFLRSLPDALRPSIDTSDAIIEMLEKRFRTSDTSS